MSTQVEQAETTESLETKVEAVKTVDGKDVNDGEGKADPPKNEVKNDEEQQPKDDQKQGQAKSDEEQHKDEQERVQPEAKSEEKQPKHDEEQPKDEPELTKANSEEEQPKAKSGEEQPNVNDLPKNGEEQPKDEPEQTKANSEEEQPKAKSGEEQPNVSDLPKNDEEQPKEGKEPSKNEREKPTASDQPKSVGEKPKDHEQSKTDHQQPKDQEQLKDNQQEQKRSEDSAEKFQAKPGESEKANDGAKGVSAQRKRKGSVRKNQKKKKSVKSAEVKANTGQNDDKDVPVQKKDSGDKMTEQSSGEVHVETVERHKVSEGEKAVPDQKKKGNGRKKRYSRSSRSENEVLVETQDRDANGNGDKDGNGTEKKRQGRKFYKSRDHGENDEIPENRRNTPRKPKIRLSLEEQMKKIEETQKAKKVVKTGVKGAVKWYSVPGRYGFIGYEDGDIFVHQTAISKSWIHKYYLRSLAEGEHVEFDIVEGQKGLEAANITGPDGFDVAGVPWAFYVLMRRYNYSRRNENINRRGPKKPYAREERVSESDDHSKKQSKKEIEEMPNKKQTRDNKAQEDVNEGFPKETAGKQRGRQFPNKSYRNKNRQRKTTEDGNGKAGKDNKSENENGNGEEGTGGARRRRSTPENAGRAGAGDNHRKPANPAAGDAAPVAQN